jgi:hypothetical protein
METKKTFRKFYTKCEIAVCAVVQFVGSVAGVSAVSVEGRLISAIALNSKEVS